MEGLDYGDGELESKIYDEGASRHMTSSTNSMINCRECSGIVRTTGGEILPIEGVEGIFLQSL